MNFLHTGNRMLGLLLLLNLFGSTAGAQPVCGDQSELAPEARESNHLKWVSKSELESSHFDVFRSQTRDGTYEKVNAEPVPAAGNSFRARSYEYLDDSIDPCLAYFYYVEAVSARDGYRVRVSPIIQAKPKRTAEIAVD